jgi:hypothetical protein
MEAGAGNDPAYADLQSAAKSMKSMTYAGTPTGTNPQQPRTSEQEIDMTEQPKDGGWTLTREDRTRLFLLQVRGTMATAFVYSDTEPTTDEWMILDGMKEPTLRQMGEIAYRTGYNVNLQLHDLPAREVRHD